MNPKSKEVQRLIADATGKESWRLWGPYLAERQWGTVREDYSANGDAWASMPHDHARSKAYRWGEDGLAGIPRRRPLCAGQDTPEVVRPLLCAWREEIEGYCRSQRLQTRHFRRIHGDDHFAADVVGNSFTLTEFLHRLLAFAAIRRSQRSRLVIDAAVQHARVPPRLMKRQRCLLFEDYHLRPRKSFEKPIRRC